jgi:phosphoribosylformylglycinamidine cyclo-ligase
MTYAESGVDIDKEEQAIKALVGEMKQTRTGLGKPMGGHYAGLISFGKYALVLCTDGVGSKVLIATQMKRWDSIGIDCMAMNVNDALCVGAEPLAFVDYLALDTPNPSFTREIGKGLEKAAELANVSIIGGETASLPEIINGFDLAGTALSYVMKDDIITGDHIAPGDVIIGLKSSGIHSNGYSLVRHIINSSSWKYTDHFPDNLYPHQTIGDVLLTPTAIYVKEILSLLHTIKAHGLAHITGGGLRNFNRLNNQVQYIIDNPFIPQDIFSFLQKTGNVDDTEMYQTFNMGLGFAVIVSSSDKDKTVEILNKYSNYDVQQVGFIDKGNGVSLPSKNLIYR